jgi:outer membrane protein
MNTTIRTLVLAVAPALACGGALAQDTDPSTILKVGIIRYQTHSQTNGVTGVGIPAGADAKVGSANTIVLTAEYRVMPNIGVELVLGVPPKIKARATGSVAFLGDIAEASIVAPTLLAVYHFRSLSDAWQPYIGAGINYTKFTNTSSPYGFDVKLSDSWGPAAEIGLDYHINRQWGLFASIGAAKTKSKLVATGATVLQSTIDFAPRTYAFGAYCHF